MTSMLRCLFVLLCLPVCLAAQTQSYKGDLRETYQLQIKKSAAAPVLDGALDDACWEQAAATEDFRMSFPTEGRSIDAANQTTVRMTYDEQFLYFGVTCFGSNDYVVQTLKRDTDFWEGDAFAILIDPVNQRTNGFSFGVNPAGVQTESLISQVSRRNAGRAGRAPSGINVAWDNKWYSFVQTYPDRWTIEIAIPFKSLRFESGKKVWGINFIRADAKTNSLHTWSPVPVQFLTLDLGFTGALIWDEAPQKVRNNVSLIPYLRSTYSRDFEEKESGKLGAGAGGDAKIALSSTLNLDVTVNPDFSQVEVDQQVSNLTRFNVRFPERRLFFLENSDLFEDFGIPPMRPFFSRKIGLDEEGQPIPIRYGARLSGNLNPDLRIGVMNMQTGNSEIGPAQNYTAIVAHQKVFARSVIKGYLHNRQATGNPETTPTEDTRAAGLEMNYISGNGKWRAFSGYSRAFRKDVKRDNFFYVLGLGYDSRNISFYTNLSGLGDEYESAMGFIPLQYQYDAVRDTSLRVGFHHQFSRFGYTIYPKNHPKVNAHELNLRYTLDFTDTGGIVFNQQKEVNYQLKFASTALFNTAMNQNRIELLFPFSFTDDEYEPLPAGVYSYWSLESRYQSDQRKRISFEAGFQYGGFYNGMRTQYLAGLRYRAQPWGNFGLNFEQNNLRFPTPYGNTTLFLVSPRIEVNFSRSLFWTTFLQYNTQNDNFNINSRLQWRFQPMSDLFIVYTDNYAVEFWGPKNRALVLKLNYWFNL